MSAPPSKTAFSAPAGSHGKGGFYLQPQTRMAILATCLALMIGASVYAVLQPLDPDPQNATLSALLRYPRETNPFARLQFVACANDYACRLNSLAINGTGDLPEVWAVGNVGLVLHRKAGESRWEQLKISATEEVSAVPAAAPGPTPAPTPVRNAVAAPTPTPEPRERQVPVPYLIGMRLDGAQKAAIDSGFQLHVEYEKGSEPSPMAQQAPPTDLRVIRQSPDAKSLAPLKSIITVTLGRTAKSAAGLLDILVPQAYAAVPEKRPERQNAASSNPQTNPAQQSGLSASVAGPSVPLVDDLIHVFCPEKAGCRVLGRSGRIYKTSSNTDWTFVQALFVDSLGAPMPAFSLIAAPLGGSIMAKSGTTIYECSGSPPLSHRYVCSPDRNGMAASADNLLKHSLPRGKTVDIVLDNSTDRTKDAALTPSYLGRSLATIRALFGSSREGFAVGDHGIVLSTTDGGKTWRHETQGPEGAAPNHRLPAPWYWALAFLLIVICSVVVAAPPPPAPTELSVADWTVTDAPLKPGDVDSLNFTPMALGLSRFIRNPKTEPPVTIAIEGKWGEGKSSVMGLLRGDLEKSRYRPVWFNAWHHQSEEQLLAALLEHIKSQAVPPWWHIDNWIFRARLLHFRLRQKWPLVVLLVLALCGSIAFELARHGLKTDDFFKFGTDLIKLVKYLLPWSSQSQPPEDLGHFGLVATVLAVFAAVFKKARAFGINPAKLTDNLRDAATIKDVKPDPGVRPRFAREFGDLCKAWSWGGRRVIIFIDDLDRCRPESVVTVLESINFLTTAGDCIIVLGMAQEQVTHCVGLGFKDLALAEAAYQGSGNTDQEKAAARYKYGELYIRKLVNIVAQLPKTTAEQRSKVLEARAAESRRKAEEEAQQASAVAPWRKKLWKFSSHAGHITLMAAPVLALVLAAVLSAFIGYKQGIQQPEPETHSPAATNQSAAQTAPTPQPTPGKVTGVGKPLIYDRPTSEPATLKPGEAGVEMWWWSYAATAFLLVVLFGILAYQFSARTNQDAQNSPEFEESLQLWGKYIVGVCDTPREIKRALNDLRYQAMTRRNNGPSTTRGERLIRVIRQFVTGRAEKTPIEVRVDEAALPPLKAAALAGLTDEELNSFLDPDKLDMRGSENLQRLIDLKREHLRHFQRWIGEAKLVPQANAMEAANQPQARTAHHA
jgi:KAP-like P-loop domain-containing protein